MIMQSLCISLCKDWAFSRTIAGNSGKSKAGAVRSRGLGMCKTMQPVESIEMSCKDGSFEVPCRRVETVTACGMRMRRVALESGRCWAAALAG
jgi:hypothetical protein